MSTLSLPASVSVSPLRQRMLEQLQRLLEGGNPGN
jgi:hypothetical protein